MIYYFRVLLREATCYVLALLGNVIKSCFSLIVWGYYFSSGFKWKILFLFRWIWYWFVIVWEKSFFQRKWAQREWEKRACIYLLNLFFFYHTEFGRKFISLLKESITRFHQFMQKNKRRSSKNWRQCYKKVVWNRWKC